MDVVGEIFDSDASTFARANDRIGPVGKIGNLRKRSKIGSRVGNMKWLEGMIFHPVPSNHDGVGIPEHGVPD